MTIHIIVADDHEIFREGLRAVLQTASDMEVVGYAADGYGAIELALRERPDVAVIDISMPGVNGVEATRQIRSRLPTTKVLCLSVHGDETFVTAALAAGASGYQLKECAMTELLVAIRAVQHTGGYISPALASMFVKGFVKGKTGSDSSKLADLTVRERQILQLISEGYPTKRIAQQLSVSAKTVSSHREHLMEKLDIYSVASLTKYAIRAGLTTMGYDATF